MLVLQIIQTVDVNIFALVLLILISVKVLNSPNGKTPQARAFSILLVLNCLIIVADSITVIFDGHPGFSTRIILLIASTVGYSLQVLICLFWFWYVRVVIFSDRKLLGKTATLHGLPALVCIGAAIFSISTGWLFSIDPSNYYHRGPLFPLIVAVSLLYLFCGYYMVIHHRKKLDKRKYFALLSFAIPPSIAGIIQTEMYGVTFLWPSMTISLLIVYLAIQNELLLLDYQTGLNNRRSFDFALARKIANAKNTGPFALMLIDIDNFRSINDRYGHIEGDQVLQNISKILGVCFQKKGFIARYGGDEFAVIVDLKNVNDLEAINLEFCEAIDKWNETSRKQWKLSVSIGSAPYMAGEHLSQDVFFLQVDKLLCLDKIIPGDRRFKYGRRV